MSLVAIKDVLLGVKLDPPVDFVHLFVAVYDDAPEGLRRATRPLQSDYVLPRPAAALHQRQERPGATQSQIKGGGETEKEKNNIEKRKHSPDEPMWKWSPSEKAPPTPQLGFLRLSRSCLPCCYCHLLELYWYTFFLSFIDKEPHKLWRCCVVLRAMMKDDGFKYNLGCFLWPSHLLR